MSLKILIAEIPKPVAWTDTVVVYKREISTPTTTETYIGLCYTTFKSRYRNHMCSFKNEPFEACNGTQQMYLQLQSEEREIYYQMAQSKAHKIVYKRL